MQEILLKTRYFERGLSKSLKKVNFIFSFEPSPFCLPFALKNMKQIQKNSFIRYILSDQV